MLKFKTDRLELLKELRKIVTKELEHSDNRRESRRLRIMRRSVDKWIKDLKETDAKVTA